MTVNLDSNFKIICWEDLCLYAKKYGDRGASHNGSGDGFISIPNTFIEDEKQYDIAFGFYAINATDVQVVMTVNSEEVFKEVFTDTALLAAQPYFGVYTRGATATLSNPGDGYGPGYPTTDVVVAEDKWVLSETVNKPSISGTTVTTDTTNGYCSAMLQQAQNNTLYKFTYNQTLSEQTNTFGSVFLHFGDTAPTKYYNVRGVRVEFWKHFMSLYVIDPSGTNIVQDKRVESGFFRLTDGQDYEMEFGICDVTSTEAVLVLKINGRTLYEVPITDANFLGANLHVGVQAISESKASITGIEAVN